MTTVETVAPALPGDPAGRTGGRIGDGVTRRRAAAPARWDRGGGEDADRGAVGGRGPGRVAPARKETPMRALRTSWAVAWLVGVAPTLASAQAELPSQLLNIRPSLPGVD